MIEVVVGIVNIMAGCDRVRHTSFLSADVGASAFLLVDHAGVTAISRRGSGISVTLRCGLLLDSGEPSVERRISTRPPMRQTGSFGTYSAGKRPAQHRFFVVVA